jgi:hypothetical protein
MIVRSVVPALTLALATAACGSTTVTPGATSTAAHAGAGGAASTTTPTTSGAGGAAPTTTSGTGGGATTTTTPPPGSETFSVTFDPVKLAPGEEDTKCVVKRVGNDKAIHVGQIHNALGAASHHFIVYKVADTEEQPTPFACKPFSDLLHPEKGTPLIITQKKDETLAMPAGVGVSFQPGQMVRLELHYINVTPNDVEATATASFTTVPDASFTDEADFLFVGDPDISLEPHSTKTLGPIYTPVPDDLADAKFFGITGHTHKFGTNVEVATAPDKQGADTPVYDVKNWTWSEPATVMHDPPFQVPKGGGFRLSCAWNNTSDQSVGFGESANDEMCFFWAYYYPSHGARVCAHTDQYGGGFDLCCPGPAICSQLLK